MKRFPQYLRALGASLLICLCLAGTGCADSRETAAEAGNLDAMAILRSVTEAKGKVVVVSFWASWCQPCRIEIPELMEVREDFGDDELFILGVSIDRDEAMYRAFVDKAEFNYPVGLGNDEVVQMFQVSGVPKIMVYDTQGRLVINQEGVVTADSLTKLLHRLLEG